MADLPIMPLYTDALLADCAYLPNEAFGGYVRLLAMWWRAGAKPLSETKLRAYSGLADDMLDLVKDHLTQTEEGWTQKKLFAEYQRKIEKSQKARASAKSRWKPPEECETDANAMRSECDRMPNAPPNAMLTMNHEPVLESTDVDSKPYCSRDVVERMMEAGGKAIADPARSPRIVVTTEPDAWLRNGFDLELDILPTIQRLAAGRPPQSIQNWRYFTDAIAEANADRTRVIELPDAKARASPARRPNPMDALQKYLVNKPHD
ncbi:MAG: hypothetical protein AAFR11_05555 [Pseudomonadota bacterium]